MYEYLSTSEKRVYVCARAPAIISIEHIVGASLGYYVFTKVIPSPHTSAIKHFDVEQFSLQRSEGEVMTVFDLCVSCMRWHGHGFDGIRHFISFFAVFKFKIARQTHVEACRGLSTGRKLCGEIPLVVEQVARAVKCTRSMLVPCTYMA